MQRIKKELIGLKMSVLFTFLIVDSRHNNSDALELWIFSKYLTFSIVPCKVIAENSRFFFKGMIFILLALFIFCRWISKVKTYCCTGCCTVLSLFLVKNHWITKCMTTGYSFLLFSSLLKKRVEESRRRMNYNWF